MSISTSFSEADSNTVAEPDDFSFIIDSSKPSSDYDSISGSNRNSCSSTCSSIKRSGSNGGGSLCSANISSDETSDDNEDSFIDDDDDNDSSTEESLESSLESKSEFSGNSETRHFDKSGTLTAFLTEYHDTAAYATPYKVSQSGSSQEHYLIEAVEQGNLDKITTILKYGINANCVDKNGRTIMHIACSLGNIQIVKCLIEYGINVDAYSLKNKQTPLHETCIGGHSKILQFLLSEVADLDMVDHLGRSAAHYCAIHGESKCLEILCSHGCDICLEDSMNRTGVHFAAMNNHCGIIQILMERGADLDVGDIEGKTPAHYAARHGSINTLEALLKNAVDTNQGDVFGSLPTHEAAYYDKLQCLKILLKKGVKCSAQDGKGRNILHKAAQGKSLNCLHWILSSGKVDANSKDFSGNTGLHYAASNGFSEGYNCLIQHGAIMQQNNNDDMSPLDVARKHGKFNTIKKADDGHCICSLCGSVQPKLSQNSISRSKETLFTMPDSVKKQQPINNGLKPDNRAIVIKQNRTKSCRVIGTQSHFTLATKYYGPQI